MSELDRKVMEAIERQRLSPRPYIRFLARRSMFWTLAMLSVLLGGISVAVMIFAVTDFLQTGGRNFDEMPFDDVLQSLPFVWLALFALFIASAYLGISNTRRGYRYRPIGVIGLAAAASIALGALLHGFGVGEMIDRVLSEQLPGYKEYTKIPYDEWRRPDEGYLGGEVLSVDGDRSLRLRDFDGHEWEVLISSAKIAVVGPLIQEGDIAIRGNRTGPSTFTATHIDEFD
jgi:hypothetical protein